ncbi:hypothetical protein JCM19232_4633 [Vibrio ishigakensis]|uniref:Uncharacterized protein n=1 Tax=Vibrio ishigakensis TaxID=1481914 RepID=A0A0B8P9F6_9VIBR|nr:hypothetical protein JCM19232_4633 [Vibrio ishigakensis]
MPVYASFIVGFHHRRASEKATIDKLVAMPSNQVFPRAFKAYES